MRETERKEKKGIKERKQKRKGNVNNLEWGFRLYP